MINKKIVLISSGQPSLNPRFVKEADALIEAGYHLTIIYQYWNKWGSKHDLKLIRGKKWDIYRIGGSPTNGKFKYWLTTFQYKIGQILNRSFNLFPEHAIGRSTPQLISKTKSIKADLYIAHNLAALPAAVIAAKKNMAKCGFDAEDYHRNEQFDDNGSFDVKLKTYIENKYIPKVDYLSTSSPLIGIAYQKLYPKHNPLTILNVFPKQAFLEKSFSNEKLKLFWFSQTVGYNRGIELVIRAMGVLRDYRIELHLLGSCTEEVKISFANLAKTEGLYNALFYHEPIPADDIFSFATKFDIGLATELSIPFNRNICLTNKIFTYIQSGLAIIASDTNAQTLLMEKYPNMGMIYKKNDPKSLSQIIKNYLDDRELLPVHQKQAYKYATEVLNWELESKKFLSIVEQTLNN